MEEETLITIMAVLIVLASFTSILLSKIKLPSLIGFLVAGIIIANYIDLPEGTEGVVSIFSNLGLIMLMFAIGMEIDLAKLKTQGKFAVSIAIIQIPAMLFAGIIAGSALGYSTVQSITFGAILSGASTAVVLAVLKTNNVLDQGKMDILILVMVIEDISQVIMISVLTPMMKGEEMSTDALIVLIISIVVFMVLCFTLGLKIVPRIIDWVYERSNDELISLMCMGLLFVFALLANTIGLSVAIGAFLTGVMVGMSRPKHVVEHFVEPLKTLFMAMFFISVGMEVSVESLSENIPTILLFYGIFALCMFVAVNVGYWVANGDSRSGWISAMSMCTMGEFAFIISKQALDYHVFDQSFYSSVIGAAIVSMVMLSVLVRTSERTYTAVVGHCPRPIARVTGFLTKQRDLLYHGLAVASYRSKENFSKGLTNSAFLLGLIALIEVAFFLLYDPLSAWLTNNYGMDEFFWRIVILFVNIIVLLEPCRRFAKFMRIIAYFIESGREHLKRNGQYVSEPRVYEYFSTLLIGAGITIVIVIVVPNGISSLLHVIVLLAALMLMMLIQYLKFRKADRAAKLEAEAAAAKEPDAEGEAEQGTGDEGKE